MHKPVPAMLVNFILSALLLAACQPTGQTATMVATQDPANLPATLPAYPPPTTPTQANTPTLAISPTAAAETPLSANTTPPYPVPGSPVDKATPVGDSPAAGICDLVEGELVTFEINAEIPSPRCAQALPQQRLKVVNRTAGDLEVSISGFEAILAPDEETIFDVPLGDYLLPGVHRVLTSAYGGEGGPELWLVEAVPIGTPGYPAP